MSFDGITDPVPVETKDKSRARYQEADESEPVIYALGIRFLATLICHARVASFQEVAVLIREPELKGTNQRRRAEMKFQRSPHVEISNRATIPQQLAS